MADYDTFLSHEFIVAQSDLNNHQPVSSKITIQNGSKPVSNETFYYVNDRLS